METNATLQRPHYLSLIASEYDVLYFEVPIVKTIHRSDKKKRNEAQQPAHPTNHNKLQVFPHLVNICFWRF